MTMPNNARYIHTCGNCYKIIVTLWQSVMINGWATTCWLVTGKIIDTLDTCDNNCGVHVNILDCIHWQLIFKGRAMPIWFFRSKRELMSALIDILKCGSFFSLVSYIFTNLNFSGIGISSSRQRYYTGILVYIISC